MIKEFCPELISELVYQGRKNSKSYDVCNVATETFLSFFPGIKNEDLEYSFCVTINTCGRVLFSPKQKLFNNSIAEVMHLTQCQMFGIQEGKEIRLLLDWSPKKKNLSEFRNTFYHSLNNTKKLEEPYQLPTIPQDYYTYS